MLKRYRSFPGNLDAELSRVSAVKLTHGIYQARTPEASLPRRTFCDDVFYQLIIYPVSLEIAQLAGRIEWEQAAKGINIPFEDLMIGATALHLGYAVATHNTKHLHLIPNL